MRRSKLAALGFVASAVGAIAACLGEDPSPTTPRDVIVIYADGSAPNDSAAPNDGADPAPGTDAATEGDASSDGGPTGTDDCANGETRCTDAKLETCNNRTWSLSATCATAALCQSRTGSSCAIPACSAGQTQCVGAQFQRCNAGQTSFDNVKTCRDTAHCLPDGGGLGGCSEACSPGERHCDFSCTSAGGPTTDDCIHVCNDDRTGWTFERSCGVSQHGMSSSSCEENTVGSPTCF